MNLQKYVHIRFKFDYKYMYIVIMTLKSNYNQSDELSWFSFIKDISGDILEGQSLVVWTRRRVFSTTWWACRTPMLTSSLVLTSWPGKWRFHRWQILGMCITLHSQIINFINRVPNDWRHFTIILLHTSFHFVHEKINSEECRKIY